MTWRVKILIYSPVWRLSGKSLICTPDGCDRELHFCYEILNFQTTVDDMIAALMSMGFELKDAQDALQFGKVSTQEAVEW
jgi:hypothetical protein